MVGVLDYNTVFSPPVNPDGSPYIGELVSRLTSGLPHGAGPADNWALLQEMLSYAAAAEQRLGEQRKRIDYLEALSTTDELTNLANRRGFDHFLRQTLSAARRHNRTGVLGYIDLDDFKLINDSFGHEAGDDILRLVANTLRSHVRDSDLVARLGGDEFAIILTECDWDGGTARARRLQQLLNDTAALLEGAKIALSASLGVARFGPESTPAELLRAADKAMYADKHAGSH